MSRIDAIEVLRTALYSEDEQIRTRAAIALLRYTRGAEKELVDPSSVITQISEWIGACCNRTGSVAGRPAYQAFLVWAVPQGKQMSESLFGRYLRQIPGVKKRRGASANYYEGLSLKTG
jgi:hypothetical protein